MSIFVPSLRNLLYSIIGNIASHELIQDPPIFYPILQPNQNPQQIKIDRYRTYGGIELMNVTSSGLTCAVYPAYVPRNIKTGSPSVERDNQKSISYRPYELGRSGPNSNVLEIVNYKLIVELHYHDVSINNGTKTISFAKANPYIADVYNKANVDRSSYLYIQKDEGLYDESITEKFKQEHNQDMSSVTISNLTVDINPGEEILRDYMELLRIVINQIDLRPFNTKSLTVKNIDFPTTNWLEDSKNVYFHMAYLAIDLELYLPCTNYLFSSPTSVSSVNI